MRDMEGGVGVHWWSGLDEPRCLLVGDYLVGLSGSAGTNLAQAAMHYARYADLQALVDFEMRRNLKSAALRGQVFGPRSEQYDNNSLEADGHFTGFFRAVGSVVDNLGGIVVGVSGMPMSIVKASWSDLARWGDLTPKVLGRHGHTPVHREFITDLIARIVAQVGVGEADWLDWTMDYRNALVHRASRLGINVIDDRSRTGVAHPLPRHPAQTQAESMAMSESITRDVLKRETVDTLDSILKRLSDLVRFVGDEAVRAWDIRRQDDQLHLQPTAQWPQLRQGRRLRFEGVGREARLASKSVLAMNPKTSQRLALARLLDQDRPQWRKWFREDNESGI